MASELLVAMKVLRKLIKSGDTEKIQATIDGNPLDKTDLDYHFFTYVLEAWRATPQEYYRCEFPYFHPKNPELKLNGQDTFMEKADVDLKTKSITLEIDFTDDKEGNHAHRLVFQYPFI